MSDEAKRYSMDEVAWEAGISYSTLLALLRKHGERIPSEMQGKNRFFPSRAIEVVREIARENAASRGRNLRLRSREKAASDEAMLLIDRAMTRLEGATADLHGVYQTLLNNPGSVVLTIRTLLPDTFRFRHPVDVLIESDGPGFVAHLSEGNLCATGRTRSEAVENLREVIIETYQDLMTTEREDWTAELKKQAALMDLVRPCSPRKAVAPKKP
ncbi:MAG: hypothetical protein WAM82_23700 [Thermoanaerobaculia bacterium]